ncbi:major facilitator superfamily domain-containing protein 8 isoform X2 [Leptopilina boulardi]|nr:major facilitator superfamily domain-containing protein 8 isoform X2 [Leptopilina boulardi]
MAFAVAANPLGQMIFSPLVGWWSNKLGSSRLPMLITLAIFTFASGLYSILEILPLEGRKSAMLVARFLVGVSSANIAVARSYLSAATRFSERTQAVSMVSLAQVLGFVVGPALQSAMTFLGPQGFYLFSLPINMYTSVGWINVLLGILNFILFLPGNFTEHKIAAREALKEQNDSEIAEESSWKSRKIDYLASWTLICAFLVLVFNFVLIETLGSSLTMNQFAWSGKEAMYYVGIMMSVGALIACGVFAMIGPICKRFAERKVMMWGGFFCMFVGRLFMIPWGPDPPPIAEFGPFGNETTYINGTEKVGCPSIQEWCRYTPQMTITQFLIGYTFTTIGYPLGVTLTQTIFSKILGPRPQGVWMGLMTGAGCVSRILGPVCVGVIYNRYGTYHTFGVTGMTLVLCMIWLQIVDKRLIPLEELEKVTADDATQQERRIIEVPLKRMENQNHHTTDSTRVPLNQDNDEKNIED